MSSIEPIKVCVINPNYYRSSGVTIAIKRIYESSKNTLPIKWYFVNCKFSSDSEINDYDWIPKDSLFGFSLMSNSPIKVLSSLFSLYIFLKREEIKILHVHHRRLVFLLGWLSKSLSISIIYTGQLTYKFNLLFYLSSVTKAVAITNSVKKNILKTTPWKNIDIISNPAPFLDKCPEIPEYCYNSVLCIARLDPVKNHENLLKAWSILEPVKNNYLLYLVGEGNLKKKLIALSNELKLGESVQFLGFHKNVTPIINKSLFLVLPSWVEGQPIAIIEGAGQGKATLLTNIEGSRDCIPKNINLPNLVNPSSPESLANALHFWLSNPKNVTHEGQLFYNYLKNKSSNHIVANEYYELYKKCQ